MDVDQVTKVGHLSGLDKTSVASVQQPRYALVTSPVCVSHGDAEQHKYRSQAGFGSRLIELAIP